MKKTVTLKEFADELILRIDSQKGIDCCKDEIKKLAAIAKQFIGDKQIEVNWKE